MKRFFLLFIIITSIVLVLMQCEKDERNHWTTYTTSDGLVAIRINTTEKVNFYA
jgi:hypothetical protein